MLRRFLVLALLVACASDDRSIDTGLLDPAGPKPDPIPRATPPHSVHRRHGRYGGLPRPPR